MGINISMTVSKHVPQEKWQAVYKESLELAKAFHLADFQHKEIHGYNIRCLVPTEEIKVYGETGWRAVANYDSGDYAESFFFPRELNAPTSDKYTDVFVYDESGGENCQNLWGGKTQGKSYHLLMLAIGCLVQDRLGNDAFVHGDITTGQCRDAIKKANKYLENPISIPCQCDSDRWIKRAKNLPVSIALRYYMGKQDAAFGEKLRENFSHEALYQYWQKDFSYSKIGTYGFQDSLQSYLSMGFDIGELCDLASVKTDKDKEVLVRDIMDSKLYIKEKDCSDWVVQDPDDPTVYGVDALLIRTLSFGARNKKVDNYIPIEELRKILCDKLGNSVTTMIDAYLQREKESENAETFEERFERDPSAEISNLMNKYHLKNVENIEKYEISSENSLEFYRPGDKIAPNVEKRVHQVLDFVNNLSNDEYREIITGSAKEQKRWLVAASEHLYTIRDRDWERILTAIEKVPGSFLRYFPLWRIELNSNPMHYIVMALIINDDLYNDMTKK